MESFICNKKFIFSLISIFYVLFGYGVFPGPQFSNSLARSELSVLCLWLWLFAFSIVDENENSQSVRQGPDNPIGVSMYVLLRNDEVVCSTFFAIIICSFTCLYYVVFVWDLILLRSYYQRMKVTPFTSIPSDTPNQLTDRPKGITNTVYYKKVVLCYLYYILLC
jgi:hypothetical protein